MGDVAATPSGPTHVADDRVRAMADNAPAMLWMSDASGSRALVSDSWLRFTGRPGADAAGVGWASDVHPDDRPACLRAHLEAFEHRRPLEAEYRLRRHDGTYRWVLDRGHPHHGPDGSFEGFVGACLDIDDRRRHEEEIRARLTNERRAHAAAEQDRTEALLVASRLARLQRITAALGSATSQEEAHERILEEVTPAVGGAALSLAHVADATPPGTCRVLRAGGYADDVLSRWVTFPLDAHVPLADVLRGGSPVYCSDRSAITADFPLIGADVVGAGRHAIAALPLRVGGRTAGALGISFDQPQPFDAAQRRFLEAVAAECAAALERVQLHDAERLLRARLEFLLEASRSIAAARDPDAVLRRAATAAAGVLADGVLAWITDGVEMRRRASAGVVPDRPESLPSTADDPVAAAARRNDVVPIRDGPGIVGVALPLEVDGDVAGVLELRGGPASGGDALDRDAVVASFLGRVAASLGTARRSAEERSTAAILQAAVMPSRAPNPVGWDIGAVYLPAGAESFVGGDWYEVVSLGDGRVAVAVGDVAGHGLRAATAMVAARNTLRAYIAEHNDPAEALCRTNTFLHGSGSLVPGAFVTVVLAVIDSATGAMRWASAGHPPLLTRTAAGTEVHPARGVLLGPFPASSHETRATVLEVGDVAVMYSDGLVERPDEDLPTSVERLRRAVSEVRGSGQEMAASLVRRMLDEDRPRDDVCVLVVRRSG